MDSKSWQEQLAGAITKNPRAAFSFGAVLVILFLASALFGTIGFIRIQNTTTLDNNAADIRELKDKVTNLQDKNDSLINLVGEVRAEGLREKVALKDQQNAELSGLNKAVKQERDAMAQELKELRAAAAKNNRLSEISK